MTVICSGGGGGGGRVPSGAYPTRGIGGTGAGSGGLNNDTTVINAASSPTAFGCGGGGGMWYLPSGSDPTGGYAGVVIVRYLA
jgi:hypothetical protein